jgi:hypothetical protein
MNMRQAHYLPSGSGDWQLGFGVIEVEGVRRTFYPVPMASDGSFTFQGQLWK